HTLLDVSPLRTQHHRRRHQPYTTLFRSQYFGTVEEHNGTAIDWKSLYEKALNHDYPEIFTGDIKTPVKYASSELNTLFREVEETMTVKFIEAEFPEDYHKEYKRRLKEGKDDSIEGQILSVADKVDLLYESFGEIQKRNPEKLFFEMYENSLITIKQYSHLSCVQDFMHNILT